MGTVAITGIRRRVFRYVLCDTLKPTPPARVISFRRCLLASGILTSPLECFIAGHSAPAAAVHGYLHLHLAESKEQAMASVAAVFVH
ncbi:hypothetical protein C8J57DRAFT_1519118 [Mycena rebaudengoi]|nr:hypothetical protein C8J57DRAFT_1519118 [Mycena rebaudengoi]